MITGGDTLCRYPGTKIFIAAGLWRLVAGDLIRSAPKNLGRTRLIVPRIITVSEQYTEQYRYIGQSRECHPPLF
eukprot:SAG31_NODE_65_length_28565_cov_8.402914_39_plen_74_part_00